MDLYSVLVHERLLLLSHTLGSIAMPAATRAIVHRALKDIDDATRAAPGERYLSLSSGDDDTGGSDDKESSSSNDDAAGSDAPVFFNNSLFADAILRCADETGDGTTDYWTHRIVLARFSPLMKRIFDRETPDGYVEQLQTDETVRRLPIFHIPFGEDSWNKLFPKVLHAMYSGKLNLNSEDAPIILDIMNFLEAHSLKARCIEYLCESLSQANALEYLEAANRTLQADLTVFVRRYMCRNFDGLAHELGASENLALDALVAILGSHNLVTASEERVFETALAWLNLDSRSEWRRKQTECVLACVRFGLLTPLYISKCVRSASFFSEHPDVINRVLADSATREVRRRRHSIKLRKRRGVKRKRSPMRVRATPETQPRAGRSETPQVPSGGGTSVPTLRQPSYSVLCV